MKYKMAIGLLFCVAANSGNICAEELVVAVAANFAPTLEKIAEQFAVTSGHQITPVSGSTGRHYAQIRNGAPYDVFLAADASVTVQLEAEGLIVPESRMAYAQGRLALWSRNKSYVDAEGNVLRSGKFSRLAIANPRLAPYGTAALETLVALGIYDSVSSRIVQGENIAQAFQFTESRNAELGLVAYSQVLEAGGNGSFWLVPETYHKPITQELVILKDTAASREFLNFMASEQVKTLISESGYSRAISTTGQN